MLPTCSCGTVFVMQGCITDFLRFPQSLVKGTVTDGQRLQLLSHHNGPVFVTLSKLPSIVLVRIYNDNTSHVQLQ